MSEVATMGKYKPYPAYKDSGIEWLGEVPEHWMPINLGRLFRRIKRTGFEDRELLSVYRDYGVIPKSSRDDNNNKPSDDLSPYQLVEKNNLVMNKMKTWQGSIAISEHEGIVSPAYFVYEIVKNKADLFMPKYVHYLLRNPIYIAQYLRRSKGIRVNQWDLDPEEFQKIELLLPSTEEQQLIFDFLDRETQKIDTLIEKQQKMIELLKEKIISLALNEQINGSGEEVRLRHLVKIINRPVHIKSDQEYEALGLYNRGRGLFHKPRKKGEEMGDSDFFYVRSGDLIISGQFAWEGAVTMATESENDCVVSHRYPILRGLGIDTEYLLSLLFTEYGDFLLNESSRGSAGRNRPLNLGLLLNEKIRIPSRSVQDELKRLIKLKTATEVKSQQAIELLKERKTALISAAVTGKIDVRGVV